MPSIFRLAVCVFQILGFARSENATAAEVDAQLHLPTINCQSLVPGMSQYGDSQDIFEESYVAHVGTQDPLDADEVPVAISLPNFSTKVNSPPPLTFE